MPVQICYCEGPLLLLLTLREILTCTHRRESNYMSTYW